MNIKMIGPLKRRSCLNREELLEYHRRNNKRKKIQWEIDGKCMTCGGDRVTGIRSCAVCRNRYKKRLKKQRQERKKDSMCITCGLFHVNTTSKCKHCIDNDVKRSRNNVSKLLHGMSCSWYGCTSTVLEFDHVHGTKEAGISTLKSRTFDRLEKEASKCKVSCSFHHRIDTMLRLCPKYQNGYLNKRSLLVLELKHKRGCCLSCGMKVEPGYENGFDFHHRDPDKKINLVPRMKIGLVESEAEKCDLLCANCHRSKHTH